MKILQINATFGIGSTGTIVRDLFYLSITEGFEVFAAYSYGASNEHNSSIYPIGNTVDHKIHALLSRINGRQAYFSKVATKQLIAFIEEKHPDIIHLHNLHNNYLHLNRLLDYLSKKRIRVVITMHDCWYFTGGCFHFHSEGCNRWQEFCGNCTKKLKDTKAYLLDRSREILQDRIAGFHKLYSPVFVGVSDWITSEFKKSRLGHHTVLTIHNGVDTNVFRYQCGHIDKIRGKFGLKKKFVILGAANKWLDPQNKALVEAICNEFSAVSEIVVFGCPPNVNSFPDCVKTIGYLSEKQYITEIYNAADVFINCSHEDSLPTVDLECQSCGTPVIGYNNTGIPETLGPGSICVGTDNIAAVIESIHQIFDNADRKDSDIANNLRNWVIQNYNKENNYKTYISLYRKILEGK